MAQPPRFGSQQVMPPRHAINLHHMLDQKPPGNPAPSGMGMQPTFQNVPQQAPPPPEKTIVDDFEAAFQSCLAPLLPGSDNMEGMTVSPEKLRSSVEHSIQQFTEQARKVESYFLKKHAMVAQRQPEVILQEEIEDLREELNRRDAAIRNHANKVAKWQENLRNLQNSLNERGLSAPSSTPNPQVTLPQVSLVHPDVLQQMAGQRR